MSFQFPNLNFRLRSLTEILKNLSSEESPAEIECDYTVRNNRIRFGDSPLYDELRRLKPKIIDLKTGSFKLTTSKLPYFEVANTLIVYDSQFRLVIAFNCHRIPIQKSNVLP